MFHERNHRGELIVQDDTFNNATSDDDADEFCLLNGISHPEHKKKIRALYREFAEINKDGEDELSDGPLHYDEQT